MSCPHGDRSGEEPEPPATSSRLTLLGVLTVGHQLPPGTRTVEHSTQALEAPLLGAGDSCCGQHRPCTSSGQGKALAPALGNGLSFWEHPRDWYRPDLCCMDGPREAQEESEICPRQELWQDSVAGLTYGIPKRTF